MPVRPLDLQVNINSVVETSRAQSVKHSLAAEQQRSIDHQSVEDARNREKMVNQTEKPTTQEKLSDKEKHFAKTEAEIENEEAKEKHKEKQKSKKEETAQNNQESSEQKESHIDYLA